ncbi:MAG: hypothetical protein OIF32_07660 [Campylobacterales bacterium]|nr:hypothetical protein [Campylobacterales bacterium]
MIKNYFFGIFSLTALLLSYQSVVTFDRMVKDYEKRLSSSYSIIVVTEEEISLSMVKKFIPKVKSLDLIDSDEVIKNINNRLSAENILELQEELPLFYRIKLNYLPRKGDLDEIEESIFQLKGIIKVESFANLQNRISALFTIVSSILSVFTVIFLFTAVIITLQLTRLWKYEYSEKLSIMAILGAKMWKRSKELYVMTAISSVLAVIITFSLFTFLSSSTYVGAELVRFGLDPVRYEYLFDTVVMIAIAFITSMSSLTYVIIKTENEVS